MKKVLFLTAEEFVYLQEELKVKYSDFEDFYIGYLNHLFKVCTYRNQNELEKYIYDGEGTQVLFNWTGDSTFSVDTIKRALRYSAQGYKICSHCHHPIKDNEKFYQEWGAIYCEDCKDLCGEMDTTGD